MGLTLVEKIAARHADGLAAGAVVRAGDFVSIRPRHVMTHDNTGAVIPKFKQIGATVIADPAQPVFAIDHDIQNVTPKNLEKYAKIEAFAAQHGIDFYPAGTGISHQVMVEQGYVVPGALVVASDSHSNLYGAMAALGTPVVRTDAASIWATGVTWWQVPAVAKVVLKGNLSAGVTGKDVIIALCGLFNKDEVLNHAVEFMGDGVVNFSMAARMTIANMTTEWGALAGVFPFDQVTVNYLRSRVSEFTNDRRPGTRGPKSRSGYTNSDIDAWWSDRGNLSADADAHYAIELELDLATVVPHVSGPNEVKTMVSLAEIERKHVPIQKAYLMSCVNARLEDLHDAAEVVRARGGSVAAGVEFYLAAASAEVQAKSESAGDWQTLVDAGAIPAARLRTRASVLVAVSCGQRRNRDQRPNDSQFQGAHGRDPVSRRCILGVRPPSWPASALAGFICAPQTYHGSHRRHRACPPRSSKTALGGSAVSVESSMQPPRFPPACAVALLFIDKENNLNTDGIFAGKAITAYRDDLTLWQHRGRVTFENFDPNFEHHLLAAATSVVADGTLEPDESQRRHGAEVSAAFPCVIASKARNLQAQRVQQRLRVVFECPELGE